MLEKSSATGAGEANVQLKYPEVMVVYLYVRIHFKIDNACGMSIRIEILPFKSGDPEKLYY